MQELGQWLRPGGRGLGRCWRTPLCTWIGKNRAKWYLNIDQDRARALGVSTANLAKFLQSSLTGSAVSQYREDNELIEILLRGTVHERTELSLLPSLAVPTQIVKSRQYPIVEKVII